MKYVLQTKELGKNYGSKSILKGVSINVPKGSIYGIIGMNGSGKTTLMRILTNLATATEGSYRLFDSDDFNNAHKRIGMLIENPGIYKNFNARQNLEYFRILYGIPEKVVIDEVLKKVNLDNTENKKVKKFSLGMKQRLSIAIALLGNPDMLILDEPINGLDPEGVFEIRNLLIKLNEDYGVTIIISSHILSELFKIATDYAIIHNGVIIEEISKEYLEGEVNKCIKITVEKDDVQKTARILEDKLNIKEFDILPNNVFRIFGEQDISNINISLVKEDIKIISLNNTGSDVEEYFLNKIKGVK